MTTCKICNFKEVRYHGELCPKCTVAFQAGERSGKNHIIKETRQRLHEIERFLNGIEIK